MSTRLEGIVLDSQHMPLVGATVKAFNTQGYTEGEAVTNSNGYFLIINLSDRDWVGKVTSTPKGDVQVIPPASLLDEHDELEGVRADQHHLESHLTRHHTLGPDALSLDLLAGTIIGPGHGDQTGQPQAIHAPTDLLGTPWRVFYADADGILVELPLGADGTFLQANGAAAAPSFAALAAGDIPDISATYVPKALFDAQTILAATTDDTPAALTVAEQRLVGRKTGGNIAALTGAEVATILALPHTIQVIIDGGGSAITTGVKAAVEIPFGCTITGWTIVAPKESGSIVIDVWKDVYASFPPTVADTIAGSEKPTISAAQKGQDLTLTTWTTTCTLGDWLIFNVDSASTVTLVTLSLRITRT